MKRSAKKRVAVMLAIDTNVIVRYLIGDHPEQTRKARALIDDAPVFVSRTVLLETEWVLRSAYDQPADAVAQALRSFAGLPTVTIETPERVALALTHAECGMDFADALHLVAAGECDGFATFDSGLVKAARRLGIDIVRKP